jgi:hypothetical protein
MHDVAFGRDGTTCSGRESMKGTFARGRIPWAFLLITLLAWVSALGQGLWEDSVAMASRISAMAGGFPLTSGSGRLDAALRVESLTIGAFVHPSVFPLPAVAFGGEFGLAREWLSLKVSMESDPMVDGVSVSIRTDAAHPGWTLLEGPLSVHAGWNASASVDGALGENGVAQSVTVSPSLTAITTTGMGAVVSKLSGQIRGTRTDARVTSDGGVTLLLSDASLSFGVEMDGVLGQIVTVRGGVEIPSIGMAVEARTAPQAGGWVWELRVAFTFGDAALVPDAGAGDDACIGGTCYGP